MKHPATCRLTGPVAARLAAVCLASLLLACVGDTAAAQQAGQITGVVLANRQDDAGRQTLLVSFPRQYEGKHVDKVAIELPRGVSVSPDPLRVPGGWELQADGRKLRFSGSPLDGTGYAKLLVQKGKLPESAEMRLYSGGTMLLDGRFTVTSLPAIQVVESLEDVLSVPRVAYAGESLLLGVLDRKLTPLAGTWIINGNVTMPDPASGGIRVTLADSPVAGDSLSVVYEDPWGDRVVSVPHADDFEIRSSDPLALLVAGDRPLITSCTAKGFQGKTLCVCGWFPDGASQNGLRLNGRPLGMPAAASTRTVFVKLPADAPPGPHVIDGDPDAGFDPSNNARTTVLGLRGELDIDKMWSGQSTQVRFWIDGTDEPLPLKIINRTPGIITLSGGDRQVVTTSGGTVNTAQETVTGVQPGDFTIHYRLDLEDCPCAEPAGDAPSADGWVEDLDDVLSLLDRIEQADYTFTIGNPPGAAAADDVLQAPPGGGGVPAGQAPGQAGSRTAEEIRIDQYQQVRDAVAGEIREIACNLGGTSEEERLERLQRAKESEALAKGAAPFLCTATAGEMVIGDIYRQREKGIYSNNMVMAADLYLARAGLSPDQTRAARQVREMAVACRGAAAEAICVDGAVVLVGGALDAGSIGLAAPVVRGASRLYRGASNLFGRLFGTGSRAATTAVEQAVARIETAFSRAGVKPRTNAYLGLGREAEYVGKALASRINVGNAVKDGVLLIEGKPAQGKFLYVIDEQGRMFIDSVTKDIKHSSLVAEGESVYAAGIVDFQAGKPVIIDAFSGHFFQEAILYGDEATAWVSAMKEFFSSIHLPEPSAIYPGLRP